LFTPDVFSKVITSRCNADGNQNDIASTGHSKKSSWDTGILLYERNCLRSIYFWSICMITCIDNSNEVIDLIFVPINMTCEFKILNDGSNGNPSPYTRVKVTPILIYQILIIITQSIRIDDIGKKLTEAESNGENCVT
jgi:hypothetical protein